MTAKRASLLNRVMRELPEGFVADSAWLAGRGLSASSIRDYVERGWLDRVGSRLYRRPTSGDDLVVSWERAVLSLQNILGVPVHVGGMTALELAGYWQYAPAGRRRVWLYGKTATVNSFLRRIEIDADARVKSAKLFDDDELGVERRMIDLVTSGLGPIADSVSEVTHKQLLRVSSIERAILEILEAVPGEIGFAHGAELLDGLTTLRPKLIVALLQSCTSVKTKRLFLYLASKQGYAWARRLKKADFDLGSGKRQIVVGGELDPTYLITVPRPRKGSRKRRSSA
ncbi:MAG: type IV toxin-antitoxin system AbiEi family antitoxin domain-containing protein [Allopontixanthobacter sediminis]